MNLARCSGSRLILPWELRETPVALSRLVVWVERLAFGWWLAERCRLVVRWLGP
jgi:hypothetical protein